MLETLQKQGYQLNDENMIGRRYAISSKVPLAIVMVSTKQLQADKQRIENNAYKTAEKNYQTQKALLEKRQQANQITIEIYRQEIQQLQNSFEKYQSLIDGLAEHYAHTDYDELEAKEQEINAKQQIATNLINFMSTLRQEYWDTTNQYIISQYQRANDMLNALSQNIASSNIELANARLNASLSRRGGSSNPWQSTLDTMTENTINEANTVNNQDALTVS